jgi:predicted nucleic acid-binding protein
MTMIAYPDSSFIVSLYIIQTHSPSVHAYMATMREPLQVTSLLRYEFCNAIRRLVFQKLVSEQIGASALAAFDLDVDNGVLVVSPVPWEKVIAEAERLSSSYTPKRGHRSFDVIHLATALTLGVKEFLSFDSRQRELAKAEGLKVKP